ncbi:methyltransferase [Corynebacterium neomassiliense]|uniref:DUF7782 domain-containing protein n=1 Tax=Corynebacterium neomassiliense TaxID=2079482 RepID=UPI00103180FC|nr:methyltransferase [Corynebacterium neomassiliense]
MTDPRTWCADPGDPALGDLVAALTALGYRKDSILSVLGAVGWREALRGNPAAALRRLRQMTGSGPQATPDQVPSRAALLTEAFFLRRPVPHSRLVSVLGADLVDRLCTARVLVLSAAEPVTAPDPDPAGHPDPLLVPTVDIRPVDSESAPDPGVLIASDPDASLDVRIPGPEHVPGVGRAPLTLLNQVPPDRAGKLLDLGTGSGVLALTLPADTVVATDIHERALDFARASERSVLRRDAGQPESRSGSHTGARSPVDWRAGSWFDPVRDEKFDRIVSNPPFVIGDGTVGHIYRDSGMELDGASRLVTSGAAEHLCPGGTAHLLGAWATGFDRSPASRVASWLPDEGIRAWVIQRDEVDPETYVRTWLTDESVDLRTPAGRQRTLDWLDMFDLRGITRIGMGYLHLQRIDGPTEVTFEEITTPDPGYFGGEVTEWFRRSAWLSDRDAGDVLAARYAVRPTVARETVELPDPSGMGFRTVALRLTRTDGPRFSHEIDAPLSAVVAGLNPRGLSLGDTAGLYCAVNGLDEDEFTSALCPLAVDLVRHGILLPADLLDDPVDSDDSDDSDDRYATDGGSTR